MKNSFILLDFCLALAAVSCSNESEKISSNESEKINTAPACQITSPSDGAMVTKPGTLVITGEIKDAEDNVVSASLSVNGKIDKENLELPSFSFTLSLDEIERGECTIALEAKDDEGLSGQSEVKIGLKDENASALLINGSDQERHPSLSKSRLPTFSSTRHSGFQSIPNMQKARLISFRKEVLIFSIS